MKVGRIAHAGVLIQTEGALCAMDPLFFNTFETEGLELFPSIKCDVSQVKKLELSCVILSHEHSDHFSIPSLNLIKRKTPIVIPSRALTMGSVLSRMGFGDIRPLETYSTLKFGDLEILATPSRVSFPEMGVLFKSQGKTCWNLVDTRIDVSLIKRVLKKSGPIDLLLATYQPLIEMPLHEDGLGGVFPQEKYLGMLQNVKSISPKLVVPSSCGFKSKYEPWINSRQFPVTEDQFLRDARLLVPNIKSVKLSPGDVISLGRKTMIKRGELHFVKPLRSLNVSYQWRPQVGVPPLRDRNPKKLKIKELRNRVTTYLEKQALVQFQEPLRRKYLERLRDNKILWRLEVVYPDGTTEIRSVNFSLKQLSWKKGEVGDFPQIQTTVASSSLLGYLDGSVCGAHFMFGGQIRTAYRLYGLNKKRQREMKVIRRDPLLEISKQWADERSYLFQLRKLNF